MLHKSALVSILAGAVGVMSASAASATTFPIGTSNFFISAGSPFGPSVTAIFFDTPAAGAFDDSFTFTIPTESGFGSGSISTSFSGAANQLSISSLTINGSLIDLMSNASGQSAMVGGIPITAGQLNTIRVVGTSASGQGSFSGTATFVAAAVPEASTWMMAILGFGFVGYAMRRQRAKVSYDLVPSF